MSELFEPTSIGTLEIPNRFVRSATAEHLGDEDGCPLPELKEMYVELAQGGVGYRSWWTVPRGDVGHL
jgi:2,4-dienoyl-CoA reductase-like NADH-dependent reductase (Old Yellow Enzyme family)